jgi:adhesin transport system outer membrane protein
MQKPCVRRLKNQFIAWTNIDKLTPGRLLILAFVMVCWPVQSQATQAYRSMLPDMLQRHPAVRAADQQRQAASQEVEGARWQYFPTPSIGVESSNQTSQFADSKIRFVRLQQPLWTGGRLTAQTDRAKAQLELADATWREQRHNLAIRWLELWAESAAARSRVQAYAESEELHLRYVRRVQARAQEGQIARSEIQLSISRLTNVQAELELARAQQQQAMNKLLQMWGRTWSATDFPHLPDLRGSEMDTMHIHTGAVAQNHPVLQKSRAQILLAQTEVDFARARLSPEVYARAEISHGNISGDVQKAFIGLSTSLGGGLSNLTAIGSAQSRVEAQRQELEVRSKELSDVLTADQINHLSQSQRALQFHQSLEAAQAYLQSSETQFDNGRRSWQELMNSAREKSQIRAQLTDASAQAWLAAQRLRLNYQGLEDYLARPAR